MQAQARVQFLRQNRVPVTAAQLGSVWHGVAFGSATRAGSPVDPSGCAADFRRHFRCLRAASSIMWLSGDPPAVSDPA